VSDSSWPTFYAEDGSWMGMFDSYDQRNELAYYLITPKSSLGKESFIVALATYEIRTDLSSPEAVKVLQDQIGPLAAAGETNTTYRGRGMFVLFD
jgi:hypothetical protein